MEEDMRGLGRVIAVQVVVLLLTSGVGIAKGPKKEAAPTPAAEPTQGMPMAKVLEECQQHPSVKFAGTPLEACMDAYGYVPSGNTWVKKPAYR
jgi:hypothetical protein